MGSEMCIRDSYYAPPEVVIAFKDGRQGIQVAPAIDVWSLGVRP